MAGALFREWRCDDDLMAGRFAEITPVDDDDDHAWMSSMDVVCIIQMKDILLENIEEHNYFRRSKYYLIANVMISKADVP